MTLKTRPYDTAEYLTDDQDVFTFLEISREENDLPFLCQSLEQAARAFGIAHIAKLTGMSHTEVVRSLHVEDDADAQILLKVVDRLSHQSAARNAA